MTEVERPSGMLELVRQLEAAGAATLTSLDLVGGADLDLDTFEAGRPLFGSGFSTTRRNVDRRSAAGGG